MSWMVGIDTGGTFTDLAALDTGSGPSVHREGSLDAQQSGAVPFSKL